jgi:hypothetical protein
MTGGLPPFGSSWRQAPLRLKAKNFFLTEHSLWRENGSVVYNCCWFSPVILRSESRGTHDHILRSQIQTTSTSRARSPYLYPPGTGGPVIPQALVYLFVASYDSQAYGGDIRPIENTRCSAMDVWEPHRKHLCSFQEGVFFCTLLSSGSTCHIIVNVVLVSKNLKFFK